MTEEKIYKKVLRKEFKMTKNMIFKVKKTKANKHKRTCFKRNRMENSKVLQISETKNKIFNSVQE